MSKSIEIEGTLKGFLQQVTGNGQNGQWHKQEVIFTIPGEYTNDVCIEFWNEKINELLTGVVQGRMYKISININSNTKDGLKYFTSLRAWKIEAVGGVTPAPVQPAAPVQPQYKIGDVVNGHILQANGWVPHTPPPAPVAPVAPPAPPTQQFAPPAPPVQHTWDNAAFAPQPGDVPF
jgi:hypothetical protein